MTALNHSLSASHNQPQIPNLPQPGGSQPPQNDQFSGVSLWRKAARLYSLPQKLFVVKLDSSGFFNIFRYFPLFFTA